MPKVFKIGYEVKISKWYKIISKIYELMYILKIINSNTADNKLRELAHKHIKYKIGNGEWKPIRVYPPI